MLLHVKTMIIFYGHHLYGSLPFCTAAVPHGQSKLTNRCGSLCSRKASRRHTCTSLLLLADNYVALQVLYSAAPIIHLVPCQQSELRQFPHYDCPLYCTPERRGVLATTGHSTNFVMDLMIPSDRPQDHWCRRGVAFLLSLAG